MDLQDEIIERLVEKKVDLYCQLCESNEIITHQNDFAYLPIKNDQDGKVRTMKCMYMTCGNCGHITIFDTEIALQKKEK